MLCVPELLLDLLHFVMISRVLAHVVAQLDSRSAVCSGDLDDNVEGLGLFTSGSADEVVWDRISIRVLGNCYRGGRLTCEEGTHAEGRAEPCLLCECLVFQAVLDIQGIGEHDRLPVFDTFAVVEVPYHFDEVCGITRVLTNAGVGLSIGLVRWFVFSSRRDRGLSRSHALRIRPNRCVSAGSCGAHSTHASTSECGDWLAESI